VLRSKGAVRIYFDHNATTPVAPPVVDAVSRALAEEFGNASSVHHFGQQAKAALDTARGRVAALLHAESADIVFTAGGTESDNFAIRGAAEALDARGRRHLVASAIEHEAVLNTCRHLERRGWRLTLVAPTAEGLVDPDAVREVVSADTALVSVMHANNEIGTVQPIAAIAGIAHGAGALFHTDAVQTVGKVAVDVRTLGADLLSLSGHKFGAPKGTGALWIRRGTRLVPMITGGRHERNRRAGTENVPSLVGFGVAATLAADGLTDHATAMRALRDRLEAGVLATVPGAMVNGRRDARVPNTSNISFDRVEAESLLIALDLEGIAVSTGSACSSGTIEPSHVLKAMRLPPARTQSAIRFSLGHGNTADEVDRVIAVLPAIVEKLRSLVGAGARAR
jgi:cysteine desulfurase